MSKVSAASEPSSLGERGAPLEALGVAPEDLGSSSSGSAEEQLERVLAKRR